MRRAPSAAVVGRAGRSSARGAGDVLTGGGEGLRCAPLQAATQRTRVGARGAGAGVGVGVGVGAGVGAGVGLGVGVGAGVDAGVSTGKGTAAAVGAGVAGVLVGWSVSLARQTMRS